MNPLSLLLRLPLLPLKGVIRLGQLIQQDAERQMAAPGRVRRELEDVEQAQAAGVISDRDANELQYRVVARYLQARQDPRAAAEDDEG
jgi:Gas vesicle protein G